VTKEQSERDQVERVVSDFKIVGRYLYPDVESSEMFQNPGEALTELRKWQKEAKENGQRFQGRVVRC